MKKRFNPYSTKNAFYIALIICFFEYVLITTTSFLNFNPQSRSVVSQGSIIYDVVISYIASVIMLFILIKFSFWIVQKKIEPHKKHIIIFFGLLLIAVPLSFLFSYLLDILLSNPRMIGNVIYKKLMQDVVFAFIVFILTIAVSSIVHNQQVESESMRNRYEALKNQLDPHFLFNSLNTLDGLIGYDDEGAHDYLQNLSLTFRYTIQNKEITELGEELKLVEAYAYLMKIRYGENLFIKYNIEDRFRTYMILPVSLQLLIENAIKHNTINDKKPLYISVETTKNGNIKVANNKNPKLDEYLSSGIGLNNLMERFMIVFNKKIKVEDNSDYFSVELPLIEKV
ncbi:MAG: histidine kinase [Bacteroidales bacterium]|jgi:LytS/YehU family sensor histidine kinase|nr:histidine kinase [Bacteroidales bacterium]